MEFFNVLGDIRANSDNFNKWEKQERDNDARREALYAKKPPVEQEMKAAKAKGDTIINAVTLMDQYSEDMSEDVEQVVDPFRIVPVLLTSLTAAGATMFGVKKFLKYIDKEFKKEDIKTFLRNYKTQTKRDKLALWFTNEQELSKVPTSAEQRKKLLEGYKKFAPIQKKFFRLLGTYVGATTILPLLAFGLSSIYAAGVQVDASRIARFKAREKINDPKYFVSYSDEQKAEAQKRVDEKPKPKKGMFSFFTDDNIDDRQGFLANWKSFLTDRKAYEKWKKTDTDESKKVQRVLTPEELAVAKADKDVLQRIIKKVNNKAEEYSENMETASQVILGSSLLMGGVLGFISSKIADLTGFGDKFADKILKSTLKRYENAIGDDIKQASRDKGKQEALKADLAKFQAEVKEIYTAHKDMGKLGSKSNEYKTAFAALSRKITGLNDRYPSIGRLRGISMSPLIPMTSGGRKMIAGVTGMVVGFFISAYFALTLQKAAARAGRFVAREDLKNNPQEFISYDEEETQTVKDVKGKKPSFWQDTKEYLLFLPTAFKHMHAYNKYKNTELAKQKELQKELIKTNISEQQLHDAKNLQRKVFNTFEKVDENSQKYSEIMEAANETAAPIISNLVQYIFIAPFAVGGIQFLRGKLTVSGIAQKVINLFSAKTHWLKSDRLKNYIKNVGDNMLKSIDKRKIDNQAVEELKQVLDLKTMDLSNLPKRIYNSKKPLIKFINTLDLNNSRTLNSLYGFEGILPDNVKQVLKKLSVELTQEKRKPLINELKAELVKTVNLISLPKIVGLKLMAPFLKKGIGSVKKFNIDKLNNESIQDIFGLFRNKIKGFDEKQLEKVLLDVPFTHRLGLAGMKKSDILSNIDKVEKICKGLPKEELQAFVSKVKNKIMTDPDKFIDLLITNPNKLMTAFMTPGIGKALAAATISWGVFLAFFSYSLLSYFATLQKQAGRLGVMKALDSLKDPAYYADYIPEEPSSLAASTT